MGISEKKTYFWKMAMEEILFEGLFGHCLLIILGD